MMNLAEYRHHSQSLADFLPWAALVGKGVILNKDGSFQRTARFRGPDLDSATPAELVAITGRLNIALRRLGSGWAIFIEAQRQPANHYPRNEFPDAASGLVDAERRAQFEEEGTHFESRYFLTLLWLPPADDAARAEAWLYENRAQGGADWRAALAGFVDRTDRVLALVEGFMPEAEWLDDPDTLTYLHSCISTRRQRVRVPETPMHLDAILIDEDLTGGLEPRLGRAHLRTLTIMGFPSQTWPGLLDDLNRLAFPYRWATRAICLDKTDATRLLAKIRRQWFTKRKSIMAILKEVMTNEASVLMDSDAANKALDADAALQELGSDLVGQAYVTATVTVWSEDPRVAEDRLRLVEKTIQGRDFTCMRETVNAIEASAQADRGTLRHYGIEPLRPARVWRTITPAALPQTAARRRIDPRRLRDPAEQKGPPERAEEQGQAAGAAIEALRHAGVTAAVAAIRMQREPFTGNGERAEAFAPGTRFVKERLWHVEIAFAQPVGGPLIIGDGRYLGLGVMAPVSDVRPDVAIFRLAPEPRVSTADRTALLAAVRRALMALSRQSNGGVPRLFSGHETNGAPAQSGRHEHLFLSAADFDGDGYIETLIVSAPWRCDHSVRPDRSDAALFDRVVTSLEVVRAGKLGIVSLVMTPSEAIHGRLVGPARIWESHACYNPTRPVRKADDPVDVVRRDATAECRRRGLPMPEIELQSCSSGIGHRITARLRLSFAAAVMGPLILGRDSHQGGGLFLARI